MPFSPGIISASSRVLGNFSEASITPAAEGRTPNGSKLLRSASYALSKNLTNQPENTTGLISNIPNPFDLDSLSGLSFLDRRHVVTASWVWSPQRDSRMPSRGRC